MPGTDCGFPDAEGQPGKLWLTAFGPTLHARIGFDPQFRLGGEAHPKLPEVTYAALVDTGAYTSCIDSTLADALQLPIVGRETVAGVHGPGEVNMHLAQIHIPELTWVVTGRFAGVHLQAGRSPHSALLGRLFLEDFTMVYNGSTGSVIISTNAP